MAQTCQMYKLNLVRTPGLIQKGGDSMWFLVCWATLPVSVIWLWDFCTPGIPRPWGFGHLFVRSFIILVEGKEKQNRHKTDEHELILEMPYWNSFKWLEMYFIFNRNAYIVYRNAFLFLVELFCVIIIDSMFIMLTTLNCFGSLFSFFLAVRVQNDKPNNIKMC